MPLFRELSLPFSIIHCNYLFWAKDNNQTKRYIKKKEEKKQARSISRTSSRLSSLRPWSNAVYPGTVFGYDHDLSYPPHTDVEALWHIFLMGWSIYVSSSAEQNRVKWRGSLGKETQPTCCEFERQDRTAQQPQHRKRRGDRLRCPFQTLGDSGGAAPCPSTPTGWTQWLSRAFYTSSPRLNQPESTPSIRAGK